MGARPDGAAGLEGVPHGRVSPRSRCRAAASPPGCLHRGGLPGPRHYGPLRRPGRYRRLAPAARGRPAGAPPAAARTAPRTRSRPLSASDAAHPMRGAHRRCTAHCIARRLALAPWPTTVRAWIRPTVSASPKKRFVRLDEARSRDEGGAAWAWPSPAMSSSTMAGPCPDRCPRRWRGLPGKAASRALSGGVVNAVSCQGGSPSSGVDGETLDICWASALRLLGRLSTASS